MCGAFCACGNVKKHEIFLLQRLSPHLARLKRAQNQITKDPLPAFLFNLKIKKERRASPFYENIIFAQNNLLKFLLRPLFSKKRAVQSKKGRKTAPFYDTIKFYQTNNRSFLPFWQVMSVQMIKNLYKLPDNRSFFCLFGKLHLRSCQKLCISSSITKVSFAFFVSPVRADN